MLAISIRPISEEKQYVPWQRPAEGGQEQERTHLVQARRMNLLTILRHTPFIRLAKMALSSSLTRSLSCIGGARGLFFNAASQCRCRGAQSKHQAANVLIGTCLDFPDSNRVESILELRTAQSVQLVSGELRLLSGAGVACLPIALSVRPPFLRRRSTSVIT